LIYFFGLRTKDPIALMHDDDCKFWFLIWVSSRLVSASMPVTPSSFKSRTRTCFKPFKSQF